MTVLPTIRRQLVQAAERNAAADAPTFSSRTTWRVPRRVALATSHLITAALVAVTVVVAVGAILLLGHGSHLHAAGRSQVPASREQLLRTLGALRASPTAADRRVAACIERFGKKPGGAKCLHYVPEEILITENPAPMASSLIAGMGNPKWDLTLIRTVPLGRSGASVTLFPGRWRPYTDVQGEFSSPPSAQRTWGIVAAFVDHGSAQSSATSVATLRAHGLALLPYAGPSGYLRVAIIVPDGVAKITVGTVSLGGQHWLENVTAAVHDNVATVQLKTPSSRFNGVQSATAQMTWFNTRGKAVKRTTATMQG